MGLMDRQQANGLKWESPQSLCSAFLPLILINSALLEGHKDLYCSEMERQPGIIYSWKSENQSLGPSAAYLMSLWRKRQLLRRLAELPRQQVTSPYSCMILIISHMAAREWDDDLAPSGSIQFLHTLPSEQKGTQSPHSHLLTFWGTICKQRNEQRHIVNVLQVGPHLVDSPWKFGLKQAHK